MKYLKKGSVAILVSLLGVVLFLANCSGEKRTTYASLEPDVHYTGIESCKSCHERIYDSYVETGMGRSFYKPVYNDRIEDFDSNSVVFDPHLNLHYYPFWKNDELYILEFRTMCDSPPPTPPQKYFPDCDTLHKRVEKVSYIIGSGNQTRSYVMERNGFYLEAPITWYVSKGKWDLSPGYHDGHNARFDRGIGPECMVCHTGHVEFVEGTMNQYSEISLGIDCEKCHGPGEIHIREMEKDRIVDVGEEIDYTIVNPAKLSIQKQFDVCRQCHLQGLVVAKEGKSVFDFRPGMDLTSVYEIFGEERLDHETFGIASHAERLMASKCFVSSGEKLTCTTCHDPHKSTHVTGKETYIKQCQSCHETTASCTANPAHQEKEGGNCVACHMPKGGTTDIPHVTFTDHKIRVLPATRTDTTGSAVAAQKEYLKLFCMSSESPDPDAIGRAHLYYFERENPNPYFLDQASSNLRESSHYELATTFYYQGKFKAALDEIEIAEAEKPENTWILYRKGEILEGLGRTGEALEAYQNAYDLNPKIVEAGLKVGVLTLNRKERSMEENMAEARLLFLQLKTQKPFDKRILSNLAFVQANLGSIDEAEVLLNEAIRLDPDYVRAYENMISVQLIKGDRSAARTYFDKLLFVSPDYPGKELVEAQLQ